MVDAIIAHKFRSEEVEIIRIHGEKVPVLNVPALIAMKEKAGRPQDLEDVRALREIYEKN